MNKRFVDLGLIRRDVSQSIVQAISKYLNLQSKPVLFQKVTIGQDWPWPELKPNEELRCFYYFGPGYIKQVICCNGAGLEQLRLEHPDAVWGIIKKTKE